MMGELMSKETLDQTTVGWVEPELAAMEQAEMVWEEMERKKVEREEMKREEMEREEMQRKKVEAEGGLLILGIPVYVDDRRFRGLARAVLGHIGDRYRHPLRRNGSGGRGSPAGGRGHQGSDGGRGEVGGSVAGGTTHASGSFFSKAVT